MNIDNEMKRTGEKAQIVQVGCIVRSSYLRF